jgi:hypothetical protein
MKAHERVNCASFTLLKKCSLFKSSSRSKHEMITVILWYVVPCHLLNDCQCFEGLR